LLTRRSFLLASCAAIAAPVCLGFYTVKVEPRWVELVHRALPIRGLPSSLTGRTLVHVSDIHVGSAVDDEYIIATFRRIAALRPDIVVVTGDFISYHSTIFEQMESIYRHFPKGRLATLACLGNHDYGPDWSHPKIAARIVDTVGTFGITVLRNLVYEVEGLRIVGLDDLWGGQFDETEVLPLLKSSAPTIVLSHNPDTVDVPVWKGYEGWILSGHTHGGQCKPPFLPPPLLPVNNPRYTAGEIELSGSRRLYISRGVGYLLQVRFNVRPEVTVFELRGA